MDESWIRQVIGYESRGLPADESADSVFSSYTKRRQCRPLCVQCGRVKNVSWLFIDFYADGQSVTDGQDGAVKPRVGKNLLVVAVHRRTEFLGDAHGDK